jgi:hypothetical protein
MRVGSLFSGVGGFDLGFEQAGHEIVWQVEFDEDCQAVLRYRWPAVSKNEDICDVHTLTFLDEAVRTWYCVPSTPEEDEMAGQLKKLTKEQALECVRMYDAGLSLAHIAAYFSVSRQAMWDLLRRRTTMRPQQRAGAENHFYRDGGKADDQAQNLCETAIQQGVLVRKSVCEECGSTGTFKDGRSAIQAHHDDYNKPLSVRWLCQPCHHEWHKTHRPIRKGVLTEVSDVDILVGGFP